jgi:hypothetical protein
MWENNITKDLSEMGSGDMERIVLAKYKDHWTALANTLMNLRVP